MITRRHNDGKSSSVSRSPKLRITAEVPRREKTKEREFVAWPKTPINLANAVLASWLRPVGPPVSELQHASPSLHGKVSSK